MMRFLSNKERRELKEKAPWIEGKNIAIKDGIILEGKVPVALEVEGKVVPTLKAVLESKVVLPKVVVDMGAVRFVVSGADIMRPGIVSVDGFEKGDVVLVVDEKHGKPLAIGLALYGSDEVKRMEKGKVIKNIHWVGDEVWNA